jgi:hypothetical protein
MRQRHSTRLTFSYSVQISMPSLLMPTKRVIKGGTGEAYRATQLVNRSFIISAISEPKSSGKVCGTSV